MTDMPNEPLRTDAGMSPAWRELALKLRAGLEGFVDVTKCLPGEPEFCGADYAHHCISYGAAIKAYGEETLKHLHHGDPTIKGAADALVDHWGQTFASQGENCDRCERPALPDPGASGSKAAGES